MQSLTSAEIVNAFDMIDREGLQPPALGGIPWNDLDYFAWKHPTAAKTFMVVPLPERQGGVVGLVLKTHGASRNGMCDLCYAIDRVNGTTMALAETWARPRTNVGVNVCAEFDCSDGARGLKWIYSMGETISNGRRIERLQENVARFARRISGLAPADGAPFGADLTP